MGDFKAGHLECGVWNTMNFKYESQPSGHGLNYRSYHNAHRKELYPTRLTLLPRLTSPLLGPREEARIDAWLASSDSKYFSMGFARGDSSCQPVSSTSTCSGCHSWTTRIMEWKDEWSCWQQAAFWHRVLLPSSKCAYSIWTTTYVLSVRWSIALLAWSTHLEQWTLHHYV